MGAYAKDLNEGTFSQDTDKYKNKLMDPRWDTRRNQILKRDGYQCVVCKSSENLEVHHRQYHYIIDAGCYRNPWDYPDYLLITLCKTCHADGHNHYKIPVVFVNDKPKNL